MVLGQFFKKDSKTILWDFAVFIFWNMVYVMFWEHSNAQKYKKLQVISSYAMFSPREEQEMWMLKLLDGFFVYIFIREEK